MTIDVIEIYKTYESYNAKLIPALENIVSDIRSQREDKALDLMVQALEGLQWTIDVVFNLKNLNRDTYFTEVEVVEVNSVLKELNTALLNQDYVLLADLLEYEMLPMLNSWNEYVKNHLSER